MRSLRFLMGIGIVSILVPSMAIVLPDQFAAINPFDSNDGVRRGATALAATAPPDFSDRSVVAEEEAVSEPVDTDPAPRLADKRISLSEPETTEATHDHETPPTEESSPDESSSSTDTSKPDSTSSTTRKTTTTESNSEDDSPETVQTDGTITGDACPCKVTGTVELKGEVNLEGDLMVDGGTLVARPGVTVNGNRFQIMFMNGGKADFQGSQTSTWSGNGSNANLNRDIEFRNLRRIMFHETGKSIVKYISVIDSGTKGVEDDYPLHWHFSGNTSRGTLVEGVVVRNGKNHAFVPHASHGITFRKAIAKNTTEEALWWNTPKMAPCPSDSKGECTLNDSHDILVDGLLVDGITAGRTYRMSGVQLGAGNGNTIRDSHVKNVISGTQCSGYHWPEDANGAWKFTNNTASGGPCDWAIFVWQNTTGDSSVIDGITSSLTIKHGAYRNNYVYRNVDVPSLISNAVDYRVEDSTFDYVRLGHHSASGGETVFENVSVGEIEVRDGSGDAATYRFTGDVSCGDVVWRDAHSGSELWINGDLCEE